MNRGDTPIIKFTNIPFDTNNITNAIIYLWGSQKLEFPDSEIIRGVGELSITLSQEQTIGFRSHVPIQMQIRALTMDGNAFTSNIMTAFIGDILNPEVIL